MVKSLELRMTHKYVGSYQFDDEWKVIGEYDVVHTEKWARVIGEDDFDPTEPLKHIYHVHVYPSDGVTVGEVSKALRDSFTQMGCHHEYDCCGCRSFYAKNPVQLSDENYSWQIEVNSYRNY